MRTLVLIVAAIFCSSIAFASAPVAPELDPTSLASGLGLAAAIVLALSGRR